MIAVNRRTASLMLSVSLQFNADPFGLALALTDTEYAKGKVMSDTRRVKSDPKRGDSVMSTATVEAFEFLNAGTRKHYRGAGDSPTAARDRAAKEAGITPAQAERVWKRWRTMASVDGDVYRGLRNKYGHLCAWIENAADAMERETREIEESNATFHGHPPMAEGMARSPQGEARQEMK